jgi:REP element-mobilizing transposase RayT
LHGDPRGSVDREHNQLGEPILGEDLPRRRREAVRMATARVVLSPQQRAFIEVIVPVICERRQWTCHIVAAGAEHVHALVSAPGGGAVVRRLLKRWLSQELDRRWSGCPAEWWGDGGSVKWVWDRDYFRRAFDYIAQQRTTRD